MLSNYLLLNLKNILLSLAAITLLSLGVSAFAKSRYEYHKNTNLAIQKKKIKVKQLQEIIEGLSKTACMPEIRIALQKVLIETLGEIKDISPSYPGIDIVIAAANQLSSVAPERIVGPVKACETDHEIATQQKLVLAAIAQIKKLPAIGKCTYAEVKTWEEHLKMMYVQIDIDAHLAYAEEALNNSDKAGAANHFRIAQNKLAQSRYHGENKKDLMIALGDRIRDLYKKPRASET